MLPINRHRSPILFYRSHPTQGNPTSPFRYARYSINLQNAHMEMESLLSRREITGCLFRLHRQSFSALPPLFTRNIDLEPNFDVDLAAQFPTLQSSLHIRIPDLIASSCCNGILYPKDEFTASISISASIQDVFESLASETQRRSVGLRARCFEIRVYFF